MKMLRRTMTRFRNFITGGRDDRRLREELESHVALQTEEYLRAGMPPAEARRRALIKLGGGQAIREQYRAERSLPIFESLLQDCRYAIRVLRKSPVFTLVAVLTLALGIGANAAIFTLINALMLKTLPVADPKTLIRLGNSNECCVGIALNDNGEMSIFSTDTYEFLRTNTSEFEDLAAMQAGFGYVAVRRDQSEETPRSVMGEFVSGNYFRTFGLSAAAGRLLEDRDDVAGAPMTAVMSYAAWQSRYQRDPAILGSTVRVNTRPVTIVGIAPEGFFGDRLTTTPPDFYFPIESMPLIANAAYVHGSEMQWLYMIGRLRPGVSLPQLQQKVNALLRQQLSTTRHYSSRDKQEALKRAHIVLTPGGAGIQAMQEQYDTHLQLLMWASALVLLIACANIANLLLVRGMARKSEMNVRTALGARRGRIVRQLLTESVLLAGAGGLAGLAVAYAGTRMLLAMAFPGAQNVPIDAAPSPHVLAFACAVSLLTGVLFGSVAPPAVARFPPRSASTGSARDAIHAGASYTPMEDNNNAWSVVVQGKPDLHLNASYIKINPQYFDSVATRVVMGRGIRPDDSATSTPIAVVNQAFVQKFFAPGENPIGHRFGGGPKSTGDWQIVGVVENTAYESATWKDHRMYFVPLLQRPASDTDPIEKDGDMYAGAIVLKTSRPIPEMEELARRTLASINPNLSVVKFQTFSAQIADQFSEPRMLSRLTMLFGALALLLATLGLYGVTAYGVARRTSEIGIRMALGAERRGVTAMVMRSALAQAAAGLALGVSRRSVLRAHHLFAALRDQARGLGSACGRGMRASGGGLTGWIHPCAPRCID